MNKTKRKSGTLFKELIFKKKYEDFSDFYDNNKENIYNSIIDLFEYFKQTNKSCLKLKINAKVNNIDWDTEFNFNRDEYFILKRDIMPYFEQSENYEMCSKIVQIHDDLTI